MYQKKLLKELQECFQNTKKLNYSAYHVYHHNYKVELGTHALKGEAAEMYEAIV